MFIPFVRWNETAVRDYFEDDPNELSSTMLRVLRKFIFFAEDTNVVANFTEGEEFIIDNYGKQIPVLLQKVSMSSFC